MNLRKTWSTAVALIGLNLVAGSVRADGLIIIHDSPVSQRPPGHHAFAPLEVRHHRVNVSIVEQVAVTTVDQVFFNPNRQRLEGTYVFPIPRGAQIDSFSMDIDGQMVEAELLDADKARKIYEDIVRRMKDPALLEYAGQGLFKVRIFPIEPRSEKRVRMKYTEILAREGTVVGYRYPLNTEKFSSRELESVSIKVELECAAGIRSVYCPSHEVEVSRRDDSKAVIGWEASGVKPDTDFQLFYQPEGRHDVGLSLLSFRDGRDDGHFLLMLSPSEQMAQEKIVAKDVVLVLDTSGSMAEKGKLEQAKRALLFCLQNLNTRDRFEVVRFSTEAESLFGSLVEVSQGNRSRAVEFVNRLKPIGGTAIAEALTRAVEPAGDPNTADRPYMVVFLTDGRPTIGSTDLEEIVQGFKSDIGSRSIRVFCFGIGTDINTHLLDRISQESRGASQYVLPDEDIELKLSSFYLKIDQPVLANPKLEIGRPIRAHKVYPTVLPDLFKGEQLVVLGRYSGSGDAAITLTGTVNGEPRRLTYEASFAQRSARHGFIPRLWATRRVGYLLDQIRLNGESPELREEVTELARSYGIVTPYTAYLIVEDEQRRQLPASSRTLSGFDDEVAGEAMRIYEEVGRAKSGHAAVRGSQALDALKRAEGAAAPVQANLFVQQGQTGAASGSSARVHQAMQAQETRYVGGRTFYRNGQQWIDGRAQARPEAGRVRVSFGSDQYFGLMREHPEAAQWLSVGNRVILLIEDTVYEIVD